METMHAINMVRGESSSFYFAGVDVKHSNHDVQTKADDCKWILDTGETYC